MHLLDTPPLIGLLHSKLSESLCTTCVEIFVRSLSRACGMLLCLTHWIFRCYVDSHNLKFFTLYQGRSQLDTFNVFLIIPFSFSLTLFMRLMGLLKLIFLSESFYLKQVWYKKTPWIYIPSILHHLDGAVCLPTLSELSYLKPQFLNSNH